MGLIGLKGDTQGRYSYHLSTVIVDCPHCHTSNATEGEDASEVTNTGVGTMVVCRGCGRHFHAPNQVNEVGANTTQIVLQKDPQKTSSVATSLDLELPEEGREEPTNIMGGMLGDGPTQVGSYPLPPDAYKSGRDSDDSHVDIQPHDPTTIMHASDLQAELRRMKAERLAREGGAAPEPADTPEPAAPRPPREPSDQATQAPARSLMERYPFLEPWAQRAQLAWTLFLEQTPARRAAIGGGGVAALLALILLLRSIFGGHNSGAFLALTQPLFTEPVKGTHAQRAQGMVQRGQQVLTFDEVGTFVMVRDMQGRVGYVMRDTLLDDRPPSQPDTPFVDCMPAAVESDRHGCETRGDEQWDSCRSWCEKGNGTDKCTDDCRGQYELCRATCRGEAVRPEPSPPPPPRVEPPPPRAEPPPRSAESHPSKPVAKPKKTYTPSAADKKRKK